MARYGENISGRWRATFSRSSPVTPSDASLLRAPPGVRAFDRLDDRFMLAQHFTDSARRRHQQAPDALKMNPQIVEDLARPAPSRAGLSRSDGKRHRRRRTSPGHPPPPRISPPANSPRARPCRTRLIRRAASAAISPSNALRMNKRSPNVFDRDPGNEGSMLRLDVDKPIVCEPTYRRRNGKARHSEPLAQHRLVDQAARLERAGQNRLFQFAVDSVRL